MPSRTIGIIAALAVGGGFACAESAGPSDAEIAHIAYTAGEIDIRAAELALEKSRAPAVRAFAEGMVRDHKAVNKQALALVEKLGVTPEDNETSKALAKQGDEKLAELRNLSGAQFDRAYAANEVAYHQAVNGALKATLIPSAANAELKALLTTGLKVFEGHRLHAEEVVRTLK